MFCFCITVGLEIKFFFFNAFRYTKASRLFSPLVSLFRAQVLAASYLLFKIFKTIDNVFMWRAAQINHVSQ
jgi:hypothetical protein